MDQKLFSFNNQGNQYNKNCQNLICYSNLNCNFMFRDILESLSWFSNYNNKDIPPCGHKFPRVHKGIFCSICCNSTSMAFDDESSSIGSHKPMDNLCSNNTQQSSLTHKHKFLNKTVSL